MENLTRFLNVVAAQDMGVKPQGGRDLVVFKSVDGGQQFVRIVRAGEAMPKSWFPTFSGPHVSYAVSTNPNLRHKFTASIDHMSPGHAFSMECTFLFGVQNPRIVVERLEDDPVRRVEDELTLRLTLPARTIPWNELERDVLSTAGASLSRTLLSGPVEGAAVGSETGDTLLRYLRSFSEAYGLRLGEVSIVWRLSAREVEPATSDIDVDREISLIASRKRKKLAEFIADKELELERLRHETVTRGIRLTQQYKDSLYTHADEALGVVARGIDTIEKLGRAIETGQRMMGRPDPGPGQITNGALVDGVLTALPAAASTSGLGTTLAETVLLVDGFDLGPGKKREIVSALLHVIAESYRDNLEDDSLLKEYLDRVAALLRPLTNTLTSEQFSALRRVSDPVLLRERLN